MQLFGRHSSFPLILIMALFIFGCEREKPATQSQASQPPSAVDQAAQQAVDAIQAPMDKARGVEGMLEQAGDRTAETVNNAGQ